MKNFFILCTAVTILLIFDVSFTEVSAVTIGNNSSKSVSTSGQATAQNSINGNPGINPNDDDSDEANPPKTLMGSGKRVVKTMQKMASRRGVGLINGFSGFLKSTDGAFNFFGNFLREQASNVNDVAKESFRMISGLGNGSARAARGVIKSGTTIGAQAAKELGSNWQKMTKLGENATKLAGTAFGTPISIGGDVLATANRVARVPGRMVTAIVNRAIKPALGVFGGNSDEEKKDEDEEQQEVSEEIVDENQVVGGNNQVVGANNNNPVVGANNNNPVVEMPPKQIQLPLIQQDPQLTTT